MDIQILKLDELYILNQCTKFLARTNTDNRHNFGQFNDDSIRAQIAESWRFPLLDTYSDGNDPVKSYNQNRVTFVYRHLGEKQPQSVSVVGSFANLYEAIPLQPVTFLNEPTAYYALTILVPKGEVHTYKYIVDGQGILDPINPQQVTLDNGQIWSRFFTAFCTQPLCFDDWEYVILKRLVNRLLPFRTKEGQNFIDRYYNFLDRQSKDNLYPYAYRLDESVGAANFIDNILAREENHHLMDYKICLAQIDRILRQRNPFIEPAIMPRELYMDLYNEMTTNIVNGWDYNQYNSPLYFLQLLRRHTFTGAFTHPKYGGNIGAAGWAYLSERYSDAGKTLFDWRQTIEKPLGINSDYHG
ncbi:hypothetical protein C7H19_07280 [Aphanothece hegewaldii CCALA 016]|uniref:AMP-activated protein kinase glycogen-binding domain-containing protein n=1 Tax=Aphanothece hegewaldii CCALA 016 TaxID=2107694 RepID=A0A2T1M0T2_9CHRO|nr:gluconate 2-dehydrogenase subunit 3 family protein [Aphanothece hegewaldii]PSF38261.1 hypothetical protein C7H19_07280 [Aphanothece hegewaldii CCALA 016]